MESRKRKIGQGLVVCLLFCMCLGISWQNQVREQKRMAEKEAMGPCYELTVLSPITGELSYIGEPVKWAVEYAQEIVNKSGGIDGIPLKITVLDTQFQTEQVSDLELGIMAEQRIFLGPVDSPGTAAGAERVLKEKIPNIAAYSYETIRTRTAPYGISYMSDSTEGEMEAVRRWKQLNPDIEKVVIFANSGDNSQMETTGFLEETLTELGMELLKVVPLDLQQENGLKAVVEALNEKADGYISLVRAEEYGLLVTELRMRGIEEGRRITASFSGSRQNMIVENQKAMADTYIWNKFNADYEGEDWQTLVEAYKKDHDGNVPDSSVVPDMYNAVMAVVQCFKELGLGTEPLDLEQERKQIAKWLFDSPVLEGIQGEYQWIQGKKSSSIYYFQFQEDGTYQLAMP